MKETGGLRTILVANQAAQWTFSVIVMGLASFLIAKASTAGEHVIYTEVIAVFNVAVWLLGIVLPFLSSYKGYFLPFEFIMSYLWLTAFIFQAQDYNWQSCETHGPDSLPGYCDHKKAMEAFTFLSFFFTVTAILLEGFLFRKALANAEVGLPTNGHGNENQK